MQQASRAGANVELSTSIKPPGVYASGWPLALARTKISFRKYNEWNFVQVLPPIVKADRLEQQKKNNKRLSKSDNAAIDMIKNEYRCMLLK